MHGDNILLKPLENFLQLITDLRVRGYKNSWVMSDERGTKAVVHNSILFDVKWAQCVADGSSVTCSLEINVSHHSWISREW